jgi:hypothetical protein
VRLGVGKTTTALLRLKSLIGFFNSRRSREDNPAPVRFLVLTYNRTLRGLHRSAHTAAGSEFFERCRLPARLVFRKSQIFVVRLACILPPSEYDGEYDRPAPYGARCYGGCRGL